MVKVASDADRPLNRTTHRTQLCPNEPAALLVQDGYRNAMRSLTREMGKPAADRMVPMTVR